MRSTDDKKLMANYFAEARSWESDKIRAIERSRKNAWAVAWFSMLTAFAAVMAVSMLTPLKTSVPYVIRVDNTTGAVDVVKAMTDAKTNYNETINKYFLQWYVIWREAYSSNLIQDYYRNVGYLSTAPEQTRYLQFINTKNPQSPLNLYKENARVSVKIKSVSFIRRNVALVRYVKEVMRGSAGVDSVTHWAATITFEYTGLPMSEQARAVNPLGFQVIEYRNDPDQQVGESAGTDRREAS